MLSTRMITAIYLVEAVLVLVVGAVFVIAMAMM